MRYGRALIVFAALGLALPASGANITVDLNGGGDFTDIQSAIDAATPGDWIRVSPGEYLMREPLSFKGKALRVESDGSTEETVIRMAEEAAAPERRSAVVFENGETRESVLRGFTVTGGRGTLVGGATYGGGIYCDRASPLIDDCRVVLNKADRGGGIAGASSSAELEQCEIAMNVADAGGGVWFDGGRPELYLCEIRRNKSDVGGGAYFVGDVTPRRSTFIGNMAASKGGGLACTGGILLECCVIAGNRAELGAGLSTGGSSAPTVAVGCTISGNAGDGVGCGAGEALPVLVNCIVWPETFCGNAGYCLTDRDPRFTGPGVFDFNRFEEVSIDGEAVALPDFVIEEPNFELRPDSPAIDGGTSDGTPWEDMTRMDRTDDPRTPDRGGGPYSYFDIGAYEYRGCRLWLEEGMCRDDLHEITVVASWATTTMQGWYWGLCFDPEEAAIGACAGTSLPAPSGGNPCDPDAADGCDQDPPVCPCPEVMCPDDVLTATRDGPVSYNWITVYDGGITQQVLVDILTVESIPGRARFELARIAFTRKAPEARLEFCGTLGDPPVSLAFINEGAPIPVFTEGMTLAARTFRRGDANASGALDIADAIFTLSYLFARGEHPSCRDGADANDDGALDIADAITILSHLFGGAGPLPAPFGACGLDPTVDDWGCGSYAPCEGR